jgi:hypothetical protein
MADRGGKRPGAGRKRGAITKRTQEATIAILASGLTPLDYMLNVMRDQLIAADRRDDMAKAAAPYVHPKLAAIEHTGKDGGPIQHAHQLSDEDLAAIASGRGPRASTKA